MSDDHNIIAHVISIESKQIMYQTREWTTIYNTDGVTDETFNTTINSRYNLWSSGHLNDTADDCFIKI